jgi:hypothetical protein
MAEISPSKMEPDGTHVIPINRIHLPGGIPNNESTGEIRWSRRDGLTFWFETPLTSFLVFERMKEVPSGGAGSVQPMSFTPEWLAQTADGSTVRLFATSTKITTNLTSNYHVDTGSVSQSSKRVEGMAGYAEVTFHRDEPLAFWYETPCSHRLFSPGWTIRDWPVQEAIKYTIHDFTYERIRCSFPLGGPCDRKLYAGFGLPKSPFGVWLTYRTDEEAHPFWYPKPCDRLRGLISMMLGQHVPVVWRDTPVSVERLTRLYFGWYKGIDHEHPPTQLVPMYGTVEALTRGREVTARLDKLDQQFAELHEFFDPEWVVSPLWTAEEEFIDNKLALACVVLERLSFAYQDSIRPTGRYPKPPVLMKSHQKEMLLSGFRKLLKEVADSEGLTVDTTRIVGKRLDSLFQPSNNERLVSVFEELGIPLGEVERNVISNRNRSLHGQATLKDGKDIRNCDEELRRYDILRTLIGRAILHLLCYDGPYVDYGDRPGTGNFPIRYCTPPIGGNSPTTPPG